MTSLSSQVQQLRSTLRKEIQSGGPDHAQIPRILNQLANLVLRALNDQEHPLARRLVELQKWINLNRKVPAKQRDRKISSQSPGKNSSPPVLELSEKHLFMPQPGNGSPQIRHFWQLQLLLYAVAQSSRCADLEEHVGLDKQRIILAAKEAYPTGVGLWSVNQYWEYTEQALEFVEHPDPPAAFRLEGRTLYGNNGSSQARITPTQASFVNLLLKTPNKWVQVKSFRDAGVRTPPKLKGDLLRKLKDTGIELPIVSMPGAYMLVLDAP
jgi:hypothetical protein